LVRRRNSVSIINAILEPDFAIIAVAAAMGGRTTLTWATRGDGTYWLTGFIGRLRSLLLRRCKQVALTALMQLELEDLGQAITKVIAVPVDITRFTPPTKIEKTNAKAALGLESEFLIVFSGHLERRKGVDVLLRAFALLRKNGSDSSLIILGGERPHEGSYAQSLRQMTQDYGLNDCALFFGAVDEVLPFLQAADLFCLPSWREGMPNSIIEAMACGLTCIAPASAGGDELLYENAGIVPHSNSPEDLAAAMKLALGDEGLRERIGEEAVRRVHLNYTVTRVMDQYEGIWD
jgi:glycosyltransferase involved in cell wall biosynthesis